MRTKRSATQTVYDIKQRLKRIKSNCVDECMRVLKPIQDERERRFYVDLLMCMRKYHISEEEFESVDWSALISYEYIKRDWAAPDGASAQLKSLVGRINLNIREYALAVTYQQWVDHLHLTINFDRTLDYLNFAAERPSFLEYMKEFGLTRYVVQMRKLHEMQMVAFVSVRLPLDVLQLVAHSLF